MTSINDEDSIVDYDNDNSNEFNFNDVKVDGVVLPSTATYEDPTMMQLYNQNAKNVNKSVLSSKSAKINFESNLGKTKV